MRVDHGAEHGPGGQRDAHADRDHDGRVAQREEEPGAQWPLAVGHQLPRHVVDRRDVIGVERVPQPERPRGDGDTEADAELGVVEMMRQDNQDKQRPAQRVDTSDHGGHPAKPGPLTGSQRTRG